MIDFPAGGLGYGAAGLRFNKRGVRQRQKVKWSDSRNRSRSGDQCYCSPPTVLREGWPAMHVHLRRDSHATHQAETDYHCLLPLASSAGCPTKAR